MPGQSILSDYFSSPTKTPRQATPGSGAIVLSSSDDEPVASKSPSKRRIASPAESGGVKRRKVDGPSRVERFRYSTTRAELSSSLPEAGDTADWNVRGAPENPELHAKFKSRFTGPQKKRKEVEAPGKPVSLTDRYARKPSAPAKGKGKEVPQYTPLEEQIIALKGEHPGVMLLFQVGYKYKFYGEDAVNAARVLSVACFWERSFQSAMVPEQKLDVHVRRLLAAGFKVGIVKQMETAALKKAGDNRNGPFVRKMTQLYTSATRVEELDLADSPTSSTCVLCMVERPVGGSESDERVKIGLVSVQPSTAEVIYDEFEDGFMRSELETRLLHLEPGEIALPAKISKQTRRMVKLIVGRESGGIMGRVEELAERHILQPSEALSRIENFLSQSVTPLNVDPSDEIDLDGDANTGIETRLRLLRDLPILVHTALAAFIDYLEPYGLDAVFKRGDMHHFQDRVSMKLNANTLQNLEIFTNQTDFTERGSLLWIIDHSKTRMGRRLLRKWLARPLTDTTVLNARLDTVEELSSSKSYLIGKLRGLLVGLPDLERGLCRIYYKKAASHELLRVLQAFVRVGECFSPDETGDRIVSPTLRATLASLFPAKEAAEAKLSMMNISAAKDGKLPELFNDPDTYPSIQDHRDALDAVLWDLHQELEAAKITLKKPNLEYITVGLEEYLVEIRLAEAKKVVPADWVRINSTKSVYRYRSPKMMSLLTERDQSQERLDAAAHSAFLNFLDRVSEDSAAYREAIARISNLDCLFSLVEVASNPGFCRPRFTDEPSLRVRGLRHPMIEQLRDDPYVPNDLYFSSDGMRQLCLSGANFGGKSSLARALALAVIMAQIGSHVAAESFSASLIDGVYTRMGASDDLQRGRSTFMVELGETSTIMKTATSRSLVIFDELGRGTSTHDGLAVAGAVLEYVVWKINPLCVFISHWPFLGRGIADSCKRHHMSFYEEEKVNGIPNVIFLRKLAPGPASSSHGLNVARMAGLPETILQSARQKAEELKDITEQRAISRRSARLTQALLSSHQDGAIEQAVEIASHDRYQR